MENRFELFSKLISKVYKQVQKIKLMEITEFGLKGQHVMFLYYLNQKENLTLTQIAKECDIDKSLASRSLSYLKENNFVIEDNNKKYKRYIKLTEKGLLVSNKIKEMIDNALNIGGDGLTEESRIIFYSSLELISNNLDNYLKGKEEK